MTPILISVLLFALPVRVQAQGEPDTLTLAEVYRLAEERSPLVAASRSRVEAVRARERSAALPPDPVLEVGAMNFSLPGLQTDMPGAMAPAVRVMQMVPFPGKLALSGEIARAETAVRGLEAEEAVLAVKLRAAAAFHEIYEADRRIATMMETLRLLQDFERVARSMYAAGEGPQSDVLRAGVEVARMRAEIARMTAARLAASARLNGVLDRLAETPVGPIAEPRAVEPLPSLDTLRSWAADRPLLRRSDVLIEQAEARTGLARRDLWPDLSVGFQYGSRDAALEGTERMGSVMVEVSVPVFARQRQLKARDEAAAMERMAAAERAATRADVDAGIVELLAELERARTLIELYSLEVLPQAEAAVQSAFASYRVGAVDFMALLDARMSVNEHEQELHRLRAEYGQALSELESTIGRELPRSSLSATEAR